MFVYPGYMSYFICQAMFTKMRHKPNLHLQINMISLDLSTPLTTSYCRRSSFLKLLQHGDICDFVLKIVLCRSVTSCYYDLHYISMFSCPELLCILFFSVICSEQVCMIINFNVHDHFRLLSIQVGTDPKEARYWLKQFQRLSSIPSKPFAVVLVDQNIFQNPDMVSSSITTKIYVYVQ